MVLIVYELNVHRIKEYSFNEFVRKMKTVCEVTVKKKKIPKELSSDLKLFILGFIFLQMGEVVLKIASINDLQSYFRIICISVCLGDVYTFKCKNCDTKICS